MFDEYEKITRDFAMKITPEELRLKLEFPGRKIPLAEKVKALKDPGKWTLREEEDKDGNPGVVILETGDTRKGQADGFSIPVGFWDSNHWNRPILRKWGMAGTIQVFEDVIEAVGSTTFLPLTLTPVIKPKTWSWHIPADEEGNPIDYLTEKLLLESFTAQFRFNILHDGKKSPTNVRIVKSEDPLLRDTRQLVMDNVLNTPEKVLNQMSAFITGFFSGRRYEPTPKTDEEIVRATNALARKFYKCLGYEIHEGYRFDQSRHPQELTCWRLACIAQEELADTDPEDAKSGLEE